MDGSAVVRGLLGSESRATVPTDEEMERIRPYLGEEMERTHLYVRRMALANTGEDRGYSRIPLNILERLAETLPGKPVLLAHDDDRMPVGLWYHAAVRPSVAGEHGEHTLESRFYMTRDPELRFWQTQMDAGVLRYGSIAFKRDKLVCDICAMEMGWGRECCDHYPGQSLSDGRTVTYHYAGERSKYESYEGSLVTLGRQRMAQIIYNAAEGEKMDDLEMRRLVGQIEERLSAQLQERDLKLEALIEQVAKLSVADPAPPPDPAAAQTAADGIAQDDALYQDALAEVARLQSLLGHQNSGLAATMTPMELVKLKQRLQEEAAKRFPAGVRSETEAEAQLRMGTGEAVRSRALFGGRVLF
jgi:hypothetical protein